LRRVWFRLAIQTALALKCASRNVLSVLHKLNLIGSALPANAELNGLFSVQAIDLQFQKVALGGIRIGGRPDQYLVHAATPNFKHVFVYQNQNVGIAMMSRLQDWDNSRVLR
jgi:hypothetical protein